MGRGRLAAQVLLGDMGTGKSSLVLRFVKGQFFEYQVRRVAAPNPHPRGAHQNRCCVRCDWQATGGMLWGCSTVGVLDSGSCSLHAPTHLASPAFPLPLDSSVRAGAKRDSQLVFPRPALHVADTGSCVRVDRPAAARLCVTTGCYSHNSAVWLGS